jgi:hypothetical protein
MSKKSNLPRYRNIQDFRVDDLETIDAGSLWNKVGAYLVLVDDDQYVQTLFDETLFEKSE